MKDIALKAAVSTQLYVNRWANTTAHHMKRRKDRGQGAIEYVGITILVVAIVIALMNTGMGKTIATKFKAKVDSVLNHK
ncbi:MULTISPECIES: hypothetical protein [unclassified Streptomyces]|uniref:hypothetical protein n=1 Tax=unclassified Streptomyces TaxID=2593676 RepID=UPI00037E290E|nr:MULTISPECIES: hypothetical protein [unclassified Streptomyces]MYY03983.1 hypothetical protein [Streptomyces sp. SID4913]